MTNLKLCECMTVLLKRAIEEFEKGDSDIGLFDATHAVLFGMAIMADTARDMTKIDKWVGKFPDEIKGYIVDLKQMEASGNETIP
jgi:hypothetical protein